MGVASIEVTPFLFSKGEYMDKNNIEQTVQIDVIDTDKAKKFSRKKLKRILIVISLCILATAIILTTIFVIIPSMKYNKACELYEQGKYTEARVAFEQIDYSDSKFKRLDCLREEIYNTAIKVGDYERAFTLLNEKASEWDSFDARVVSGMPSLNLEPNDYENFYNDICNILEQHTDYEYWDDYWYSGCYNSHLMYYLLSNLPLEYKNVSSLVMLFTDFKSGNIHPIEDYMKENRDLIFNLWEYEFVRNFATNDYTIKRFLNDVWTTDTTDNIPFDDPIRLEFLYDDDALTFSWVGLNAPDIEHRYWDIVDRTIVFTNGDEPLCNVFLLSLNTENPNRITVYCYKDGKSYTFYRWIP